MLSPEQLASYANDGFVVVPGLLDRDWLEGLRQGIWEAFERHRPPASEGASGRDAYVQVVNMGLKERDVRLLTRSEELGRAAAQLMRVAGARIFFEDTLFKEPSGRPTPWHQDGSTLPMESMQMVTAWVPLVPIGAGSGRLRFARRSHRLGLVGPVDITKEGGAAFSEVIEKRGLQVVESPSMQPGDVSFHSGATIHGSLPNTTEYMRELVSIHYFPDGARVGSLDNEAHRAQVERFAPDLKSGDPAEADAWPLVYRTDG